MRRVGTSAAEGSTGELPRLVAVDLDGTLLGSDQRISPRNARALAALEARGCTVVLCTGRPPRLTRGYADELGLADAIVYNGASRYHARSGRSVHHHQLEREAALEAIARLRRTASGVLLGIETHHGWYLDPALFETRRSRLEAAGMPLPDAVGAVEGFVRDAVIKIFARHPERNAAELASALDGLEVYATWSGPALLETMHPAVNKRDALRRFAAELGVPRERVAAFGDQRNDLEMLAWAGRGVAVANAPAEVRAAAGEATESNDDDGVARCVERWLEAAGG